jgi:hypothetical protein
VNVQIVTDPADEVLWFSPTPPGRTHDLTAARTHKIIPICKRQGVPVLTHMAYISAGNRVTTAKHRSPNSELPPPGERSTRPCPPPGHPPNAKSPT